ncbi:MAG: hypothetical protein OEV94_12005 [Deltaproteobacteria bacterium]|nr:hypothetical protein [Deltaproteobacteria bacterium]
MNKTFWSSRKVFVSVLGCGTVVALAYLKADPMAYAAVGAILGLNQFAQGQADVAELRKGP